jgi:lactoylglutathione lyase
MYIEHIALWVKDLEEMKSFYTRFFGATTGSKYHNEAKQFQSYFLTFASGARLELMHRPQVSPLPDASEALYQGYVHMAFATGSREAVDKLTLALRQAGFTVADCPRQTGDGYYESVVLDPEQNRIEITV